MTAEQAGRTTVREFNLKHKARTEAERSKWELARWQMFLALQMQPFIKQHSKPRTAQAWIKFPWEKVKEVTKEDCKVGTQEQEQLNRMLQDFIKKQGNGQDR
jgi:hypothetical protein